MLTAYNTWANRKLVASVLDAGEERCLLQQKSSFSTICHTILHISDAQEIWIRRLHGESPQGRPGGEFKGNTATACQLLQNSSMRLEDYVSGLEDSDMNRVIPYRNIKGDPYKNSVFEILSHVVNHGTYHRGQLITLLRQTDITSLPVTDLIAYYREQL